MKYQNAFIFHGTAGSPEGNWFPWLKKELEKQGIPTIVPRFPTPEGESLEAWFKVLDEQEQKIGPDSLMIGHSKGGIFLLRVLERLEVPVKKAIFVSTPIGIKPIFYYEEDKKFTGFDFDWQNIKSKAGQITVFYSDDDPYADTANGRQLAKHLGVDLNFIPNAGHINAESGYTKFPQILKEIL